MLSASTAKDNRKPATDPLKPKKIQSSSFPAGCANPEDGHSILSNHPEKLRQAVN